MGFGGEGTENGTLGRGEKGGTVGSVYEEGAVEARERGGETASIHLQLKQYFIEISPFLRKSNLIFTCTPYPYLLSGYPPTIILFLTYFPFNLL